MEHAEFDKLILATTQPRWRKVALVVASVCYASGADEQSVASRIRQLVSDRQLEAHGDLSLWRFSEIRRPQS